jgi:transcriptional regulator with PAS, ATPase and Fis domain
MKNVNLTWVKEFIGAIIVCDTKGIIVEMNDQAIKENEKEGGEKLIGTNMLDCHPEPARSKAAQLLESRQPNIYTIQKNGKRKLIHQTPWYEKGEYRGIVELSLEIPETIPHFVRD